MLDCSKLNGRMRAICEGTSGLPPEKEAAYRELWKRNGRYGLGDLVAAVVRIFTFGRLKPTAGCGCQKRKDTLNRITIRRS